VEPVGFEVDDVVYDVAHGGSERESQEGEKHYEGHAPACEKNAPEERRREHEQILDPLVRPQEKDDIPKERGHLGSILLFLFDIEKALRAEVY